MPASGNALFQLLRLIDPPPPPPAELGPYARPVYPLQSLVKADGVINGGGVLCDNLARIEKMVEADPSLAWPAWERVVASFEQTHIASHGRKLPTIGQMSVMQALVRSGNINDSGLREMYAFIRPVLSIEPAENGFSGTRFMVASGLAAQILEKDPLALTPLQLTEQVNNAFGSPVSAEDVPILMPGVKHPNLVTWEKGHIAMLSGMTAGLREQFASGAAMPELQQRADILLDDGVAGAAEAYIAVRGKEGMTSPSTMAAGRAEALLAALPALQQAYPA